MKTQVKKNTVVKTKREGSKYEFRGFILIVIGMFLIFTTVKPLMAIGSFLCFGCFVTFLIGRFK